MRDLVRENTVTAQDLIWPLFIRNGEDVVEPVASMPGVNRYSLDKVMDTVERAVAADIPMIALFPYTNADRKTPRCEEAWNPENLVNTATREIKSEFPEIGIMLDVALDPYNALGHDGIVEGETILNDETLIALEKQALAQAEAGADVLGPSDMMDGRIGVIRSALEGNEYKDVAIMSYAAKYASAFYGPFRDAVGADSALKGDKKTYQIDPANANEGLLMVERDLKEGADMVMVKPGMPYLDICRAVSEECNAPVFAYQVSGEYAMIEAAAANGWIERDKVIAEALLAFKRAGCDGILTYHALEIAEKLKA
ncbi:MAG: porphobilinogen synthase [Pseudomonadota bacterium]